MRQPWIQNAGSWLRSIQKEDGSFGESADSYEDPSQKGSGPSTASQTAWGTMALMAVYGPDDSGVLKGIRYLMENQTESGTWEEPWFTGTGFPRVFYLRYHLYRLYFPIMCLGRYLRETGISGQ
jgi:squalene-hopene/tetraprenyl-beta-curcumene cyclase